MKRLSSDRLPYRKSYNPSANLFAPGAALIASRNAIFSNEKIML
jgi:hypothetical protein